MGNPVKTRSLSGFTRRDPTVGTGALAPNSDDVIFRISFLDATAGLGACFAFASSMRRCKPRSFRSSRVNFFFFSLVGLVNGRLESILLSTFKLSDESSSGFFTFAKFKSKSSSGSLALLFDLSTFGSFPEFDGFLKEKLLWLEKFDGFVDVSLVELAEWVGLIIRFLATTAFTVLFLTKLKLNRPSAEFFFLMACENGFFGSCKIEDFIRMNVETSNKSVYLWFQGQCAQARWVGVRNIQRDIHLTK